MGGRVDHLTLDRHAIEIAEVMTQDDVRAHCEGERALQLCTHGEGWRAHRPRQDEGERGQAACAPEHQRSAICDADDRVRRGGGRWDDRDAGRSPRSRRASSGLRSRSWPSARRRCCRWSGRAVDPRGWREHGEARCSAASPPCSGEPTATAETTAASRPARLRKSTMGRAADASSRASSAPTSQSPRATSRSRTRRAKGFASRSLRVRSLWTAQSFVASHASW